MKVTAYRLVPRAFAGGAFDGEGARQWGGRWNSPGIAVVYLSGTLSLAGLEFLVHFARRDEVPALVSFEVRFDESLVSKLDKPPEDWRRVPAPRSTQQAGDRWWRAQRSAVLRVPSVIVPREFNYLLNPSHADFANIEIGEPEPFGLDPRLLR